MVWVAERALGGGFSGTGWALLIAAVAFAGLWMALASAEGRRWPEE
jgi:hypothetical protein